MIKFVTLKKKPKKNQKRPSLQLPFACDGSQGPCLDALDVTDKMPSLPVFRGRQGSRKSVHERSAFDPCRVACLEGGGGVEGTLLLQNNIRIPPEDCSGLRYRYVNLYVYILT